MHRHGFPAQLYIVKLHLDFYEKGKGKECEMSLAIKFI